MGFEDVGSLASIIGLVVTIVTFFLAANVNKKVSQVLKSKSDRRYFDKKIDSYLQSLKDLQEIVPEAKTDVLFSTAQYAKLNNAIELVSSSWNVLMQYESKRSKKKKIAYWEKKFTELRSMYSRYGARDLNKLISFLAEFITFLEKEKDHNER